MMTHRDPVDVLLAGIRAAPVRRVILGLNWTLVATDQGAGLAHTPARDTAGCRSAPEAGTYGGRRLDDLARLMRSDNPFEVAIGVAAANAHYNRFGLEGAALNGLDVLRGVDGPITVIGRFPGLEERLPGARVVEREPRPGEYGEDQAPRLLADSAGVVITASTLVNGTLRPLLAVAGGARVVLIGPGTPLAPSLFDLGISALSGLIVEDVETVAQIIAEGGAVRALKPHCRYVTLCAEPSLTGS